MTVVCDSPSRQAEKKIRCVFDVPLSEVPADLLKATGLRPIDPDQEDSRIECSSDYHLARFTGAGSTLVLFAYSASLRLGGKTGKFSLSAEELTKYLGRTRRGDMLQAYQLLVLSGFWEVIEERPGKSTLYRPIPHKEWARKHPGFCTKRLEVWSHIEDDPLREFGRQLYGITDEKWYEHVLLGVRKAGGGMTDESICEFARTWIVEDARASKLTGQAGGIKRRKRFIDALRKHAARLQNTNDLWRKPLQVGVAETATGAA